MTRFGVEEEFFLLDPASLAPVSASERVIPERTASDLPGSLTGEFLTCQVEHSTSALYSLDEARRQLTAARTALSESAREDGCVLGACGTPFGTGDARISPSSRYRAIGRWLADIAGGHHVCGMHVHVEVLDVDRRLQALNRMRPWLPVLLSLSGNSPFWHARITGYRSWRTVLMRRLPTMGCPPAFRDHAQYSAHLETLIRLRAAPDAASLAWAVRLSARFPTVEVRVFDTQLDPDDAVLLAALTRALVNTDEDAGPTLDSDLIDSTLWMAAREGLNAALIDPRTGEVSNARMLVQELQRFVAPELERSGDRAFVEERIARIRTEGTGAERQLAALRTGGVPGLAALVGGEAGHSSHAA